MANGILATALGWLPAWLGFTLIILAGIVAIIFGIGIDPSPGVTAFGFAAIASGILAWVVGVSSTPRGNPMDKSFGGKVEAIDGWPWFVVFGLFVVATIIAVAAG